MKHTQKIKAKQPNRNNKKTKRRQTKTNDNKQMKHTQQIKVKQPNEYSKKNKTETNKHKR